MTDKPKTKRDPRDAAKNLQRVRKDPAAEIKPVASVLIRAGFTREMVERKVADILLMNTKETHQFKNDEQTCNFDLIIIAVVEAAQRNADTARLDNLLEKIFGKTVNITGKVEVNSTNVNANYTPGYADEQLIQRAIERSLSRSV